MQFIGKIRHVVHNQTVGGVVDPGARNKRENAGNQVHGRGISADGREQPCDNGQGETGRPRSGTFLTAIISAAPSA